MTEYLLSVDKYLEKVAIRLPSGSGAFVAPVINAMRGTSEAVKTKMPTLSGIGKWISENKGLIGLTVGGIAAEQAGAAGYHMLRAKIQEREQDRVYAQVVNKDPILSRADANEVSSAFDSMRRVAPTLATDQNAVQSFLRSAIMSSGGVDYNTIKLLAEAENATTGRFRRED